MQAGKSKANSLLPRRFYDAKMIRLAPYLFLGSLYMLLAGAIRLHRPGPDWSFMMAIADHILDGDLLKIYSLRWEYPSVTPFLQGSAWYSGHPFGYPPISILLLVPFRFFSQFAHLSERVQSLVVITPYLVFDLVCAYLIAEVIHCHRPIKEGERLFIFSVFLTSWTVFFSTPYHGHFESTLISFLLMGFISLRRGNYYWAAAFNALALLTKQTAILVFIPELIAVFLAKGFAQTVRFGAAIVIPCLAVFLPFLIADFEGVKYMAFTFPANVPYGFQTTWLILGEGDTVRKIMGVLQPHVDTIITALCGVYAFFMAYKFKIRPDEGRLIGLAGAATVIMVLFEKWGSLHYFLLPFVLIFLWEMITYGLPWLSIAFCSILSNLFILKYSVETDYGFNKTTALVMIVLCVGALIHLTARLRFPVPTESADRGIATPEVLR